MSTRIRGSAYLQCRHDVINYMLKDTECRLLKKDIFMKIMAAENSETIIGRSIYTTEYVLLAAQTAYLRLYFMERFIDYLTTLSKTSVLSWRQQMSGFAP
jgi:hypothetical protein